uniref:Uncharacterized protein n=1 Tax=Timema monikensis TaxID=170555 RepID=A0A7R9HQ37_9NEOP|nr:unnamed protein product [Timema monikensis]
MDGDANKPRSQSASNSSFSLGDFILSRNSQGKEKKKQKQRGKCTKVHTLSCPSERSRLDIPLVSSLDSKGNVSSLSYSIKSSLEQESPMFNNMLTHTPKDILRSNIGVEIPVPKLVSYAEELDLLCEIYCFFLDNNLVVNLMAELLGMESGTFSPTVRSITPRIVEDISYLDTSMQLAQTISTITLFRNHRDTTDTTCGILSIWEKEHLVSSWSFHITLAGRIKDLLNSCNNPWNLFHFARLFRSQLQLSCLYDSKDQIETTRENEPPTSKKILQAGSPLHNRLSSIEVCDIITNHDKCRFEFNNNLICDTSENNCDVPMTSVENESPLFVTPTFAQFCAPQWLNSVFEMYRTPSFDASTAYQLKY